MSEFKQVSREQYESFVASYPNKLSYDVTCICEPPMGSYNDFSDGKVWPESMVAKVRMYDGSAYYEGQQAEYFIKEI